MSVTVAAYPRDFDIVKSDDDLVIAGYASIEIVDKQNDLITLEALQEAVNKFMSKEDYRNVMTNHSNVQVGEVVRKHRDSKGNIFKTEVDDVGFYVVIKLRDDIEKAKEVARDIRRGSMRSFSIGGQALEKRKVRHKELGEYNEISKLELHEITICEKGINPEAKFDILKQDKVNKMNELETALNELNTLVKDLNEDRGEMLDTSEDFDLNSRGRDRDSDLDSDLDEVRLAEEDEEDIEGEEYSDNTEKTDVSSDVSATGDHVGEAGDVVFDNRPTPTHDQINVTDSTVTIKGLNVPTLDLSHNNLEKAYQAFRAEQLEKLAYDGLKGDFAKRFKGEMSAQDEVIAKANYDAKDEVDNLRKEFSSLRESLTKRRDTTIRKQQEYVDNLQIPTSEDIAKMSWAELHQTVYRITGE